jgi:carboxyl-terminal processing protease
MPDSLKYTTPGGRTVYGGGGIMPDIFIPIDTAGISTYFLRVRNNGLIYRYAMKYTEDNREILSSLPGVREMEQYLDSQSLLDKFVLFASVNGIPADNDGIKESGHLILIQLKAYIARNILDNPGFYPIWEKLDNTLGIAIDYITNL